MVVESPLHLSRARAVSQQWNRMFSQVDCVLAEPVIIIKHPEGILPILTSRTPVTYMEVRVNMICTRVTCDTSHLPSLTACERKSASARDDSH
jgi:hypothetical protein